MARITVEKCLKNVPSRFDLILLASKERGNWHLPAERALVETKDDKNTLIALKEIEEGLIDKETLDRTLEEDVLLDQFSSTKPSEPDVLGQSSGIQP